MYESNINITKNISKEKKIKVLKKHFGSSEKRFPKSLSGIVTPGPGRYFLKIMGNKKRIKNNHCFIPKNIIKDIIKRQNSFNTFKKKLNKEKNKSPPVGSYFPEKINSIEYDNQKIKTKNLKKNYNGFGSTVDRFKLLKNQKENIIDKFYDIDFPKVKSGQSIAPFLSSLERNEIDKILIKDKNYNTGPGSYGIDSYFDWNKKSYNLLFN